AQVQEHTAHHCGCGCASDEEPEVLQGSPGEHGGDGAPSTHKGRETGSNDQDADDDEASDAPPHTSGERQQLTAPMHKHLLRLMGRLRAEKTARGRQPSGLCYAGGSLCWGEIIKDGLR